MQCLNFGGSIEEYNVFEAIGKGGFATVYQATCRNTGKGVAIKKISKSILKKEKIIERVRQEVSIHSKLDHPSILKLFIFFEDDYFVYLVLELCPNGHLLQKVPLPEEQAQNYFAQVVEGVLYLHSQGIMHRDLSLQNLLLDCRGFVKIADFGLATQLKKPDDKHMTMCGTPNYISPEVATRSSHGLEADVWSLGCLLYTMLIGKPPFEMKNAKSTLTKVVIGNYEVPDGISSSAKDLIHRCLIKNPRDRIKLKEVTHHPFFKAASLEFKSSKTCNSDSGLYTLSTNGTTHHTRVRLSAIGEDQEGISHEQDVKNNMPSDFLPIKQRPKLEYQHGGQMFGNLKKKFTALPAFKNESPLYSSETPHFCHPPVVSLREQQRKNQFAYSHKSGGPPNVISRIPRESNLPAEEKLKEVSVVSCCSNHSNKESCHRNSPKIGGSYYSYNSASSHDSCNSLPDKHHQSAAQISSNFHYMGVYEKQLCTRSRHSTRKKNLEENRRSISSDGRLTSLPKGKLFADLNMRSNSLEHRDFVHQANINHQFGCCCSICKTPNDYIEPSCSVCGHCTHESWCERESSVHAESIPDPKHTYKSNFQLSKPIQRSLESQKNDILKDITPTKTSCSRVISQPQPKPEVDGKGNPVSKLKDLCIPLSSRRLKPTRQESKNAVLSILEDGQVCVEFLQIKNNHKRVKDVCRISPDGLRIALYQPNGSYGAVMADTPTVIPSEGADLIYSFDNLPQKFWKKYIYACRFINLVKERTPKITYYSDQAHCTLMENSPNSDFVAKFYSGERCTFSSGKIQFTQVSGAQISIPADKSCNHLDPQTMAIFEHFLQVKQHCLRLEEILEQMENSNGFPNFPLVIGKRPQVSSFPTPACQRKLEDKENISVSPVQSIQTQNEAARIGAYEESVTRSIPSATSKSRKPLTPTQDNNTIASDNKNCHKDMFIENLGYLSQSREEMVVRFLDGSRLKMNSYQPSEYIYTDKANVERSFPIESPSIPSSLRDKLSHFHRVLAEMRHGESATRGNSKLHSSYSGKMEKRVKNSPALPKYLR